MDKIKKFVAKVQKILKIDRLNKWEDKVTRSMIEDFNSLTDCLDLAAQVRNDVMSDEEVRQKNVKLQLQVASLQKKVSAQKSLIEQLGCRKN